VTGTVLYEREGHIATISYNRPEALNAMNAEVTADMNVAWMQFRDDPDAWVGIVTGNGRAFCAGADYKEFVKPRQRGSRTHWEVPSMQSMETGLEIWKPTIAAVNGYCLGHGLTVAASCDFLIASEDAQFGFPEVQLGMPTVIGAVRLAERVPWHYAMELLLTGETVDAARAKEMGFVWKIVPPDQLMEEARALAKRLSAPAPLAVRATKEVTWRGTRMPLIDAMRFGSTMRQMVTASEDYREGTTAKVERRAPQWKGR
jgi:E-phenylitaconyl-CoA hydratase